jgi:predicted rRNA methylase YqxC with S4 and FtsJ domains
MKTYTIAKVSTNVSQNKIAWSLTIGQRETIEEARNLAKFEFQKIYDSTPLEFEIAEQIFIYNSETLETIY